jgi:hypothetical protein
MSGPEVAKPAEESAIGLEKAKKVIEPWLFFLSLAVSCVVTFLASYYTALNDARTESRTQIDAVAAAMNQRLQNSEVTISALRSEAGRVRLYLETMQEKLLVQFTEKCERLQGFYDSNLKTCSYKIHEERVSERLPYL